MKTVALFLICRLALAQTNTNYATVSTATSSNVAANVTTMLNGDICLEAASVNGSHGYDNCFTVDTWVLLERYPLGLTAAQIRALMADFYAQKATSSTAGHLVGDIPYNLNPLTMIPNPSVGGPFCNGNDPVCHHTQGDAPMHVFLPYLAWLRDGSTTFLNANISTIETVMDNMGLRRDSSGVIVSNVGDEWTPMSFQDMVFFQGQNLFGTLMWYWGCMRLAILENALGRTAQASHYLEAAKIVAAYIRDAACPLWDSVDGMFYSSTINNVQIDVFGSALAVYLNVASSSQKTAVSTWLAAHASGIECTIDDTTVIPANGFLRESPTNWAVKPSWSGQTTGQHYQNGWSSWGLDWIWDSIALTSLSTAVTQATHFATGIDLTREQFGTALSQCGGGCYNGTTGNLESPAGAYDWMTRRRSSFPDGGGAAPTITSFRAAVSGNVVTLTWATAGSATYVYLDNGIGILTGTSGSTTHLPVAWATTYTLTAANAYGSVTAQATPSPASSVVGGSVGITGRAVIQ